MRKGQRKLEKNTNTRGKGSNQKQSKKFPSAPHFPPICFGKCCPPFYLGQRG